MFARNAQSRLDAVSASSLSASLSLSESIDLDIVNDIINYAPRSATSFAQVHDAYARVLEDNGIRPSTDKTYYQFLLKLGLIRAPTWGERWDYWQARQAAEAPKVQTAVHVATPRTIDPLKQRVPFLASASSDLDEGFADASDADSLVVDGRLSPREAMERSARNHSMRSLVGYTPTQSDDESFPAPVRTSTPRKAYGMWREPSAETYRGGSPTPPPYSESEASVSPLRPPIDRMLTPMASYREPQAARIQQMERQADEFHRIGSLAMSWGMWAGQFDHITQRIKQIDEVRDSVLLRQTLRQWRASLDVQLARPGAADAHYRHHVQRQALDVWLLRLRVRRLAQAEEAYAAAREQDTARAAWKLWRTKLAKIRTKRWEADMRAREEHARVVLDQRLVTRTFDHWRDRARESAADNHAAKATMRGVFGVWRQQARQGQVMRENLAAWERRMERAEVKQRFGHWRGEARRLRLEGALVQRHDSRLVARIWSQWGVATRRQQAATAFGDKRVMKLALGRMKAALWKRKVQLRAAQEMSRARDLALVLKVFNTWATEERGRLLQRVLDNRRLRTTFTTWQVKNAAVDDLNLKVAEFAGRSRIKTLHSSLSRWRDSLGQKRNMSLKADLMHEARTKSSLFIKWQAATVKLVDDAVTADKARAFFTLRTSHKVWRIALQRRREAGFHERRRLADVKGAFDLWRTMARQSQRDREVVSAFQAVSDQRILANTLSHWTERVVEIKSRELDVGEQHDAALIAEAFARWRRANVRVTELRALMVSSIDVKREEQLSRTFNTWAAKARRAADLRQRAEAFLEERRERLLITTFSQWHDAKRLRDLAPLEAEAAARHEDALMFAVFDKWTARARLLPAVQFDNRRLRKAAWPRWRSALARVKKERRVAAEREQHLVADGFALWRAAFKARQAQKPAPRERRRVTDEPVQWPSHVPRRTASPSSARSEPAYSRLRSELQARRVSAGSSAAPMERVRSDLAGTSGRPRTSLEARPRVASDDTRPMSELVRALRAQK